MQFGNHFSQEDPEYDPPQIDEQDYWDDRAAYDSMLEERFLAANAIGIVVIREDDHE